MQRITTRRLGRTAALLIVLTPFVSGPLFGATPAAAHEEDSEVAETADRTVDEAADTARKLVTGAAERAKETAKKSAEITEKNLAGAREEAEQEASETLLPPDVTFTEAVVDHMHNKLVHFPLALGLVGALLLLRSKKEKWLGASRLLLFLAALVSIAAVLAGDAAEEHFNEAGKYAGTLEWHESMGITTAVMLWVGLVLTFVRDARKWLWLYGLALAAVITFTGFLGGVLAHG